MSAPGKNLLANALSASGTNGKQITSLHYPCVLPTAAGQVVTSRDPVGPIQTRSSVARPMRGPLAAGLALAALCAMSGCGSDSAVKPTEAGSGVAAAVNPTHLGQGASGKMVL